MTLAILLTLGDKAKDERLDTYDTWSIFGPIRSEFLRDTKQRPLLKRSTPAIH